MNSFLQEQPLQTLPVDGPVRATSSMKYVPALDGLRAVAILAVIAFHAMPKVLKGGFTGVDVFFVLSGYLITSVILHDIRNEKFSMAEFYLRRIQRLLPNGILMIFVTVLLCSLLLLPSMAKATAAHGFWALLNLSNFYIWRTVGGYWANDATAAPLLHTWSLAVEEQFYLVFPLTLLLLARCKSLPIITAGLTLISFALCAVLTRNHQAAAFYLLPTRAWEPLLGAMLAVFKVPLTPRGPVLDNRSTWIAEFAGWIGLAFIITGFFCVTDGTRFPGIIAVIPALGAFFLLVSLADGNGTIARVLSTSFFVWIGRLSYSLYLWHWPMIVMGGTYAGLLGLSQRLGHLIGLLVAILMALIAYRFVEIPLRQRGRGRRMRLILLASASSIAIVACLMLSLKRSVADPFGYFDKPAFYGLLYNVGDTPATRPQTETRYYDVLFPDRPIQSHIWKTGGIIHSWSGGTPRVVVLGSSHALMYGKVIDDICRSQSLSVAFLSADATTVFSPTNVSESFPTSALAATFDTTRKEWVRKWRPDAVFIIDRWDNYSGNQTEFSRKLHNLVGEVAPYTKEVIVLSQPPVLKVVPGSNLREYATWYQKKFDRLPVITQEESEQRKSSLAVLQAIQHDYPNVLLLRPDQIFLREDGSIRFEDGRDFLYTDDNHLSEAGAERAHLIISRAILSSQ